MEKDELQTALDNNKSFVLKYSQFFLLAIIVLLTTGLALLQIDGKSILRMVFEYFIR
jgi:hypothetical protein